MADVSFFFDLPWWCWVLPGLLVVAWMGMWWASRRARLWFAGLTPPAAFAVILLGLFELSRPSEPSCAESYCPGGPGDLSARIAALDNGPGTVIMVIGLLALIVACALTIITFVVETTLMVRRSESIERAAAAAAQAPS
ncbi:hypothetical protein [Actinoplanes lobatus]|uniref:Uncharacterized protein n=1 Tax=Actinoplanes lobatus TaxID=113568 RepID=A0A7W7MFE1_9ACTN|nr:hypothetical protein [Actinoplanes lobatus]MBB4748219.1 hypothetical protein [Actinoplanes lobatus]